MASTPIFPMLEPQHYSDYGFDPQIDYFQMLHEARQHGKREAARPLDAFRFKLQKPISKDDTRRASKSRKRGGGGRWWRSALLFWKRRGNDRGDRATAPRSAAAYPPYSPYTCPYQGISSPVYMTESVAGAGGWPPCRRTGGGGWGDVKMPYLCLQDLAAMDASPPPSSAARPTPAVPIYLVT